MSNHTPTPLLPTTRREFLTLSAKGLGLLAFSRFAPQFLVQSTLAQAPAPEKDRTILVLVQLAGGNDGLNTVIPFEDPDYYRLRPTLGIPKSEVLRASDTHGLHPALHELHRLLGDGKLAVVQNVGYPNPNRSHFRSAEIWETASDSDQFASTGWVGRFLDNTCAGVPADSHKPLAIHVTAGVPQSFASARPHSSFGLLPGRRRARDDEDARRLLEEMTRSGTPPTPNGSFLQQTYMDTLVTETKVQRVISRYQSATAYPANPFAGSLRNVAALIAGGLPTRVYFVSLSGFDTHSNQLTQHANLLVQLSEGLAAFQRDLESHQLADQVLTMTFSEFGRRPSENESRGTDHGTAAPLFVMGSRARAGFHGSAPALQLRPNQDLTFSTDFRQVYATILDRWLGATARTVLDGEFKPLAFL